MVIIMLLKNASVFIDGKFQAADITVSGGLFQDTAANTEEHETLDLTDKLIIPGFIELHSHGCIGYDFTTSAPEELEKMCEFYSENGITSILATTMTIGYDTYKKAMENIKTVCEKGTKGSRIIGINMEGPFLGASKKGAHDTRYLLSINEQKYEELNDISGDRVRIIDLDPDLPGALPFIEKYSKKKIISLAHTSCDYDTAVKAIEAGATHVTHLFNAMNGLHHRAPGIIGAVSDCPVNAEIICDGIHIHPSVMRLVFKAFPEKLILISDSMSAAGLEDGPYELGGQKVIVKDGKAALEDGTIAGSTTTIYKAFKKCIEIGIPVEQAVLSATLYPARAIHADNEIGSIEKGKRADFIVMDKNYNIEKVYSGGNLIVSH
ncbi:N-acetylglucosamine-6-phosphate deacetylase [Anaerocolumna chitinilytica]|uniref:N-acetylglucosamine-6-phosphate deacetylase n=2 Tax=Anaerocolumna chitinilytica TaxID=1727145 RepID=A0A7I8DSX2_9FIRM|nr:N-acetylglucosamine-6-phosphate deacetylase [Anaerocolumna chitinilytica]